MERHLKTKCSQPLLEDRDVVEDLHDGKGLSVAEGTARIETASYSFCHDLPILRCVLVAVSGVILLILGLNNVLAVAFITGGIIGVGVVASSRQHLLRSPTRANDIDEDATMNRLFGSREEE
jgi:hypothetical protein